MRSIEGGNYSYLRPGHQLDLPSGIPGPWGFRAGAEFIASKGDRARWGLAEGRAYRTWELPPLPLRITEDMEFREVNFEQAEPHTGIFDLVAPQGSLVLPVLRFVECRLINVAVPEGAEVVGGNLLHGTLEPTGNPERPEVRVLCGCVKCCVVRPIIQEVLAYGGPLAFRDARGRWLHHELKPHYRARRNDPDLMAAHQLQILTENDEAIAWLDPRQKDAVR